MNNNPNNSHPNESAATILYAVPTLFYIISLVLFGLRMYVRIKGLMFYIEDWFMVISIVRQTIVCFLNKADKFKITSTGLYITCLLATYHGMGKHIEYVSHSNLVLFLKAFTATTFLYSWATTFVKLALIALILRVVPRSNAWRIGLWLLLAFVMIVSILSTTLNAIQCRPLKALWDFSYPRDKCIPIPILRDLFWVGSCELYYHQFQFQDLF
jgi:hypothetical protein